MNDFTSPSVSANTNLAEAIAELVKNDPRFAGLPDCSVAHALRTAAQQLDGQHAETSQGAHSHRPWYFYPTLSCIESETVAWRWRSMSSKQWTYVGGPMSPEQRDWLLRFGHVFGKLYTGQTRFSQRELPSPELLLEFATGTGLRHAMSGMSAIAAKQILTRFVATIAETEYPNLENLS